MRKNVTIQFQISSSSNKSRPGTCFKMCSRTWQYGRFEYHQKLLAQSWIHGLTKFQNWNLRHFGIVDLEKTGFWVGPPQPSHQQKKSLGFVPLVRLKGEVWLNQGHWYIPRDHLPHLHRKKSLGIFLWRGPPQTPAPRKRFPGNLFPGAGKTV